MRMHLPRPNMDAKMREQVVKCEKDWKVRPFAVLACSGYADEHWQIYHPSDVSLEEMRKSGEKGVMPRFVVLQDGTIEAHPDAKE